MFEFLSPNLLKEFNENQYLELKKIRKQKKTFLFFFSAGKFQSVCRKKVIDFEKRFKLLLERNRNDTTNCELIKARTIKTQHNFSF